MRESSSFALTWAPRLFTLLIKSIALTCRLEFQGKEQLDALLDKKQSFILAMWHNCIATASWCLKDWQLASMISDSKDGEIIAQVLLKMGNKPVRGSSSKGGAKALIQIIKALKEGSNACITPDGPRGPKYKLQPGIITLAQKSGAPLIPLHIEADRQWVFEKSWDHHKLPKPFTRILMRAGEPLWVPKNLDQEKFDWFKNELEARMMANLAEIEKILKKNKGKP